jgi:HNH endonuclease
MTQNMSEARKKLWKDGKLSLHPNFILARKRTQYKKGQKRPEIIGINNPMMRPEVRDKQKKMSRLRSHTEEWKRTVKKGEKHPAWRGGISFEPYGVDFNKKLREQIRKRDGYRCQECFRHQNELRTKTNKSYRLVIHHIDYNKKNNNPNNLISLCKSCHTQTNWNREQWIEYYKDKVVFI